MVNVLSVFNYYCFFFSFLLLIVVMAMVVARFLSVGGSMVVWMLLW